MDEEWTPVGPATDVLPGESVTVDFGDTEVAIFNCDGEFLAVDNVCTHQGGPLAEGKVEDDCVYCPWHGHQFDLRTGEHGQLPVLGTETFEVVGRKGEIYVRDRDE